MSVIRNELVKRANEKLNAARVENLRKSAAYIEKSAATPGLVQRALAALKGTVAPLGDDAASLYRGVKAVPGTVRGAAGKVKDVAKAAPGKVRDVATGAAGSAAQKARRGATSALDTLEFSPRLRAALMGAGGAGVGAIAGGEDNRLLGALAGGAAGYGGTRLLHGALPSKTIMQHVGSGRGKETLMSDFARDPILAAIHKLRAPTLR